MSTHFGSVLSNSCRQPANELEVDFVLNARALEREGNTHLIVELIRIEDGDHVWVEYFEDLAPWSELSLAIRDGVAETLQLQK